MNCPITKKWELENYSQMALSYYTVILNMEIVIVIVKEMQLLLPIRSCSFVEQGSDVNPFKVKTMND